MTTKARPSRTATARLALSAALVVPLAGGLAGCTTLLTPGDPIASHTHTHTEEPGTAPSDGEYVLVHKYGDATPLKTVPLTQGERLGFMTGQTGQIIAVAGDDEWIYTDNDYVWIRRAQD